MALSTDMQNRTAANVHVVDKYILFWSWEEIYMRRDAEE